MIYVFDNSTCCVNENRGAVFERRESQKNCMIYVFDEQKYTIYIYIAIQVFSKLKEQGFPSEFELRDLVGKKLSISRAVDVIGGGVWS